MNPIQISPTSTMKCRLIGKQPYDYYVFLSLYRTDHHKQYTSVEYNTYYLY